MNHDPTGYLGEMLRRFNEAKAYSLTGNPPEDEEDDSDLDTDIYPPERGGES